MKLRNNILIFAIASLVNVTMAVGQDLPSVCNGSKVRYGTKGLPNSVFNWEVQGGTILENYNDSVDVQWDNTAGIHTITATEVTAFGCYGAPVMAHVMVRKPSVDLGGSRIICSGDSAVLSPTGEFISYLWQDGSTLSKFVAHQNGTYWVNVVDSGGCSASDTIQLAITQGPKVNLGADTMLCDPTELVLDAGNGANYRWSTGEISKTITAHEGDGTIWVKVEDQQGCVGTDTIQILQCKMIGDIPNAFTPNGDGDNDVFRIGWAYKFPNIVVKIYDRWGRLVFVSDRGYEKPWDGTSKGKPLPMDSYYYIISLGDGSQDIVGSVTIIR